jgi:23S rRNA (uracil1939-C5)-methyltransferase
MDVLIDRLGAKGDGIAALPDGGAVYVPYALPGETVSISKPQKDAADSLLRADPLAILTQSEHRQAPPCPHFGVCGGCMLQHMDAATYHVFKIDAVKTTVSRFLGDNLPWGKPVFVPPQTRRRLTVTAVKQQKKTVLGFHRRKSSQVFSLETCLLATPRVLDVLLKLPDAMHPILVNVKPADIFLQDTETGIDLMITGPVGAKGKPDLAVQEEVAALCYSLDLARISWRAKERDMPETLVEVRKPAVTFGELRVELPVAAFLQPSLPGQQALQDKVMQGLAGSTKIADLFSGSGTFAGPALSLGHVTAIDSAGEAIAALAKAGRAQGKLTCTQRDLFRVPLSMDELNAFDAVILDPARSGARDQCNTIAGCKARTVIYVSCAPGTFGRDAQRLIEGGYKLAEITLIDQFVWSAHTEIVAVFKR